VREGWLRAAIVRIEAAWPEYLAKRHGLRFHIFRFDDELETLNMKPGIQAQRNDIYRCKGISAVVEVPLMNDQANP
jgi:hypothetical protein